VSNISQMYFKLPPL